MAKYYKLTTVRRIEECGLPADEFYMKISKGEAKMVASRPISEAPQDHKLEKISKEEITKIPTIFLEDF